MIQYHGTPIGGTTLDAEYFLLGQHALVPYTYPQHLHIVQECCASFVLDNGAYTIWRKGGKLDVDGYIEWCEGIYRHPGFDWALIPDVIDGSEAENDAMLNDWPGHINGVPVYHIHESLERAERLSSWPIVALGSSGQWSDPGSDNWWMRMNEVRRAFCDSDGVPRCKLHGLRMLDPAIFTHLPLHSADSCNAARNGLRNGTRLDPKFRSGEGSIITAWRNRLHNSVRTWKPKKIGRSPATLFDLQCCDEPTVDSPRI